MDRADTETRQTRQRRREQEPQTDEQQLLEDENTIEEGDDEEVTRCVCRRLEYPGAPVPVNEASRNYTPKDSSSPTSAEAAGDMFIQCDGCKVWQHGGCVGIMDESMSPEEYYCEECKKDSHKVMTGIRGQRYSRYLPVFDLFNTSASASANAKPTRKTPPAKEPDARASRDPESRNANAIALSNAKKRSTMNSRAALDEEEALRKAIEESKVQGTLSTTGSSIKRSKRSRDESEDAKQDLKRRKTASDPDSPPEVDANGGAETDDEEQTSKNKVGALSRKSRVVSAQVQREKEKELKEKEKEKEKERVEAASRRKGRAEKRHAEEAEAAEEALRNTPIVPAKAVTAAPKLVRQVTTPKIPATGTQTTSTASPSHRKNARTQPKRGRIGRNQYTRDRDAAEDAAGSPRLLHSRDGEEDGSTAATTNGRTIKPKQINPNRVSMNELKKRAAGMLEFISRTQVELAAEKPPPNATMSHAATLTSRPPLGRTASIKGCSKLRREIDGDEEDRIDEVGFKGMNSHDMLDALTRRLVHWQKDHGKWGEKT